MGMCDFSISSMALSQPYSRLRRSSCITFRVKAVSVNPVDTKVRSPKEQVETQPRILGWDAAGVVEAVGDAVSLFSVGDEVYYAGSSVRPGCDSELHLVDERIVGRKPRNFSFEEAAAMPLTTLTVWEVLFDRMAVPRAGDDPPASVLIIGGAGGPIRAEYLASHASQESHPWHARAPQCSDPGSGSIRRRGSSGVGRPPAGTAAA